MSSPRLPLCGLAALCLGAFAPAAQAQTRAFNDTFAGGSTVNTNPTSPATAVVTAAAYQQVAAKTFNPNPPVITPGNLRFGIVATSSGFNHVQALFTKYPVTLVNPGDFIELKVVYSPEGGIITPQTNSTLFFGLFNARQVQPIPGGMNGTVTTATAGYAQGWTGYVNRVFYAGGNNGFFTRPAETATAANNQDLLYNYPGATTVGVTAGSTLAAFTAGATYTSVFRITKASATGLTLSSSLYAGAAATGTPLHTQTVTSSATLTAVYDALAFGWRSTASVVSTMNVKSVTVATTGTTTIIPEILTQPLGLTKSVGESVVLTVAADGGAGTVLSYQWRKDGVPIVGATAASHAIPAVALSDAGDYTVVVTDIAGSTTSAVATLGVTTGAVAPAIIVEPAGATILTGGSHIFAATVNGTSPLNFQWERSTDGGANYAIIPGATAASYPLAGATLADAGLYRLVATNSVGSATSVAVALAVNQGPAISTQPVGGAIGPGGSITLSVTATGTPAPTFQWRKNGTIIPGATSASYTIGSATGADTATYTVVATNSVGSVTSSAAAVAVVSPTMAVAAVTPAASDTRNPDTRLTLTFNETPTVGVSGFLRIHDAATDAVVDTIDLVAATALRNTLRGVSALSTQLLPVQTKPVGGIPTNFNYYPITVSGNTATIYPRNGVLAYNKTYYVKIDAGVFVNAAGEAFAGITDPAVWRFSTRAGAPAAGTTSLTVAADGSGDFDTVQAALDFIPANNTVPTVVRVQRGTYFEEVGFQAKHFVTLVGEDADQTVITYPNNNTFNNVSGVYHRATFVAQSVHDFTLANLTVNNTTPQNGSQAEALVLNGSSATTGRNVVTRCKFFSYQDTVQFNKQTYVSDCSITGDVDFLWGDGPVYLENCDIRILRTGGYFTQIRNGSNAHGFVFVNCRFTAPAGITGTYLGRIDPAGFPFSEVAVLDSRFGDAANNAFLATVSGPSGSNYQGGWWLLNNVTAASAAASVHNWSNGLTSATGAPFANPNTDTFTTMPADAATQANYRNATWVLNTSIAGTVNGSWIPALAPIFAIPPGSQVVNAGDTATFTAVVIAIPAATYQWRKNGTDIPGANAASYSIAAARGTDTGGYTVAVSNAAGSITSAEATLTVVGELVAPTITTQPASQLIAEGGSGTLSVAALGTAPFSYQWWKNGLPIAGANGPAYAIANATAGDAGTYSVVISNIVGDTESVPAVVSVKGVAVIARTGYAAGVTGGAAGATVTVSTAADLKTHAESATPGTIIVSGTIDLGVAGRIKLQSNKTLRGATTASTILGSVNISNADNVIVSNLNISADTGGPSENDGVTIANSTNVLVTKCTIYNCTDGNLDVINGSDLVTVAWCKFYYTRDNGHNFSDLVGSSDTDTGSGDGLTNYRVTWHHNWWSGLAKQRMIACRFGSSHMFNNYWDCSGNDYCTESRNIAAVFSEHNYYDGVKNPLGKRTALETDIGLLMTIGNIFDTCTGNQLVSSDLVFTPPYSYPLGSAASVPALVMAGAGNVTTDDPGAASATVGSSAPFGSAGGSVTLTAVPAGFTPAAYLWRFRNVAIPGATAATLELANVQPANAGAYTVVLSLADGSAIVSAPHVLAVKLPPAVTTQPMSRTVTVGDSVSFTVAASGDQPLSYQWFKHDAAIDGATAATLALANVTTAAVGDYHCVVTNPAGTAVSHTATLTVQKAVAAVTVTGANVTYDGSAKSATVTTAPAGLSTSVTYNGSAFPPADAGSYTVSATVDDVDYVGSGSGLLVIEPASAAITLGNLVQTYDGTGKTATAATVPAGLPVALTYGGNASAPISAGSYAVAATITHPNYVGSASGTLVINPAIATVSLSQLAQSYDGAPKPVLVATSPAALPVSITYNGNPAAPSAAGSYPVVATVNHADYTGSATGTLVIAKAAATLTLAPLTQSYDGTVKMVTATSAPAGLAVTLTYDGVASAPVYPGPHVVVATIDDANYSGTATAVLQITVTALVRHAPTINGIVDGSVQMLTAENVALNGQAALSGDLLVPGTPTLVLNGHPIFLGALDGPGNTAPAAYTVTLNGGVVLRYLVRGVDAIVLPVVAAPAAPAGTRGVALNRSTDSAGDFATLRDLTLNGNAGAVAVPPGAYGNFTADGSSRLVLGVPGATTPAVYHLQNLTLNGQASLQLAGPVVLRLANGMALNGRAGDSGHAEWLTLEIASGGFTLNGNAEFHGTVLAPAGTVTLNGNATLSGAVTADRLIVNGNALLEALP